MVKNVIIRLISVFALFMLLSSCGGNGEESGGYGAITFSVDWMDAPTLDLSHGASRAAIDCSASGVATVTATVYDSGNNSIAIGGPWACAAHSGAVTHVPAGSSRKLVIVGNDSEGKVKYRGEMSGITVEDGKSIDAGSVATVNFVPALSAPANGATVNNGAFSFTWAGIGSAASYRIQVSAGSGFSSNDIDATVTNPYYTPSSQLSGTYYWRVRAIDAMAHEGVWSVAYSCTVQTGSGTTTTTTSTTSSSTTSTTTGTGTTTSTTTSTTAAIGTTTTSTATTTATSTTTTTTLPQVTTRKVPDTGQTTKYTTTFGEDADYTINPPSYTDNGDGTVTDNVTGLMWQRHNDGTERHWADAGTYCGDLTLGGYTGWRLPEVKELTNIIDFGKFNPTINTAVFPGTKSSEYWTSTSSAAGSSHAWYVDFYYGSVNYDGYGKLVGNRYARCVRGEASTMPSFTDNGDGTVTDNVTGLMWQKQDDGTSRNWEAAISYCEALSLDGKTDWRLPDAKELADVVDDEKYQPAIDPVMFPWTKSSEYWASTSSVGDSSYARKVNFYDGYAGVSRKSFSYYVRCVRGGQ